MNFLEFLERFVNDPLTLFCVIFILSFIHGLLPPIPFESSLAIFTGYLAGTGHGELVLVWFALTTGNFLGSFIIYYLAKTQGVIIIKWRWIKRQLTQENLTKTRIWFQKYGVWTIFIGKIIPGMVVVVLFCCGLFRVKQNQAVAAIGLTNLLYYSGLVLLSQYLGRKWVSLSKMEFTLVPWISVIILIGVPALISLYWFLKKNYKPH